MSENEIIALIVAGFLGGIAWIFIERRNASKPADELESSKAYEDRNAAAEKRREEHKAFIYHTINGEGKKMYIKSYDPKLEWTDDYDLAYKASTRHAIEQLNEALKREFGSMDEVDSRISVTSAWVPAT